VALQPEMIQFEPNTRCNLLCPICPYTAVADKRPAKNVAFGEYREIFERSFTPPYVVIFSGFSETLLNPDVPEMIRFEKDRRCQVFLATNGLLLDVERTAGLLDTGVDQIVVSLDSTLPEAYTAIRASDALDRVMKNVLHLQEEIVRRNSRSKVVINSVVARSTAAHLQELLEFLNANGISDLAFIKTMKMASAEDPVLEREFLDWTDYENLPWREILARAGKLGIDVMRSDPKVIGTAGCHLPGKGFYISADFDVSTCPFLSFTDEYVFGNLRRQSIEEITGGKRYREFERLFAEGKHLPQCRDCACLFS
jgi:radical SAM protein with 4Fe4S-binding SPASM domain